MRMLLSVFLQLAALAAAKDFFNNVTVIHIVTALLSYLIEVLTTAWDLSN
jgi:hypothetical protein